ncbi:MAG: aspartate-semialdehyde dehydrogenase, partial [Bacteroidales bacterium]
ATGLVGSVMLKVLEEYGITNIDLIPAASAKSVGKEVIFAGKKIKVVSVEEAIESAPNYAIFSAGGSTSTEYAPLFAKKGCIVIDNSSAWRMNKEVPLVIPEVNINAIKAENRIIANPNCSTIQMVLALAPIHQAFGIKRLVISTYQSVSGSGVKALKQLEDESKGIEAERVYPYPINRNILPHGGDFQDNGYTTEETKLVNETKKILSDPAIGITATVVRVPVTGGHSEAVNIETQKPFEIKAIRTLLENMPGIKVLDEPLRNIYPMPLYCYNKNEVFVGRIRRDESIPNGLNLWIVADNIRKGAATNAVQIMIKLMEREKRG